MSNEVDQAKQPIIQQYLTRYADQIKVALPANVSMTPERFARIVMTETRKNPQLLRCDPRSLFGAVIQCAQLGLEPGGPMRQAYLVPYKSECQLILGYGGMVTLANRGGAVRNIMPRAVFKGDRFDYRFGLDAALEHVPSGGADRSPSDMTHVYAVVVFNDGTKEFDVMTRAEVDAIKARSPAARRAGGPWDTDYVPMALKTVIRRVFKYIPVSAEVATVVGLDEHGEAGVSQGLGALIDGEYEVTANDDAKPAAKGAAAKVKERAKAEDASLADELIGYLGADDISVSELEAIAEQANSLPAADKERVMAGVAAVADRLNG